MARSDEKKRKDQWIPVDEPAPTSSKTGDVSAWDRPAPVAAPSKEPTPPKPAPKAPAAPQVSPEERAVWADPVLSPWAPDAGKTAPSAAAAPRPAFLGPATTSCPRCSTLITYARNGSPPWEAECKKCGAKGRFWK